VAGRNGATAGRCFEFPPSDLDFGDGAQGAMAASAAAPVWWHRQNQLRRYGVDADVHGAGSDDDHTAWLFLWCMVRKKNVLATLIAELCDRLRGYILWWLIDTHGPLLREAVPWRHDARFLHGMTV